jgi:transposase
VGTRPAYGYGGENGCKQLRVGELLTARALWARAVPLHQLQQNGNAQKAPADVGTILPVLQSVGSLLPLKDCLVVGDSKLLCARIIRKLEQQPMRFLAPVHRTDAIHEEFTGLDPDAWEKLDYLPRRQQHIPEAERTVYLGQKTKWVFLDTESGEKFALRRLFVLNEREREARKRRRLTGIHRYVEKLNELQNPLRGYPGR